MSSAGVALATGLGDLLVDAIGVTSGERVLDIAVGTRGSAMVAAARGASVVAADRTRQQATRAARLGLSGIPSMTVVTAEVEHLPFRDGLFDAAVSCVGIMFAEHHQKAADELLRVVRPNGRIGLLAWTPTGRLGAAFRCLPVAQSWATGISRSPLWGDEAHVRELFADAIDDLAFARGTLSVEEFDAPDAFRRHVAIDRPSLAARLRYAARDARRLELGEALDDVVLGLAGNGATGWEYLLSTMTVR